MKRPSNKNKYENMLLSLLFVIWMMMFLFLGYEFHEIQHITVKTDEMLADIERFDQQIPEGSSIEQTEYLKTIDFLENETAKYRDFVEKQQEYLVWLLGLIGSGAVAVLAFLGIKSRKDVTRIFQEKYVELVQNEISDFIGGERKEQYLLECIEKENRAKNKKILFVLQKDEDRDLEKIYELLKEQGYQVAEKKVESPVSENQIHRIVTDCKVLIYQMAEKEYEKNGPAEEERSYVQISEKCNEKGIYGIIFCKDHKGINRDVWSPSFYMNSANFGSTVLERLYTVLYFLQE